MIHRLAPLAALAATLLTPLLPAHATSPLVVSPSRVTLEGRDRAAELLVVNRGATAATYRVLTTTLEMGEDGRLRPAAAGGASDGSAENLLRYAPRQVTVGPGETQRVRVMVQRPPGLAAGEYRAHLLFQAIPDAAATEAAAAGNGFSVDFQVVPAVAVPVILREGELDASAEVAQLRLVPGQQPTVEARIARRGDRSLYGDLEVTWHGDPRAPKDGVKVAEVRGVAIYTPLEHRDFKLPLLDRGPLRRGRLVLTYRAPAEFGGALLARGELTLP